MKAILLFCCSAICVAFCRFQLSGAKADYLENRLKLYQKYLTTMQDNIQKKVAELTNPNVLSVLHSQFMWAIAKQTVYNELNSSISKALNDTHKYVEIAKAKADNFQRCYNDQHKIFEELKQRATLMYYDCEQISLAQYLTPTANVEETAKEGKELIEKLQTTIPSCLPIRSLVAQEACILVTIRDTKPLVRAFVEKLKSAHQVRANRYDQISQDFHTCYDRLTRPLYKEIPEISSTGAKCIQALTEETQ